MFYILFEIYAFIFKWCIYGVSLPKRTLFYLFSYNILQYEYNYSFFSFIIVFRILLPERYYFIRVLWEMV